MAYDFLVMIQSEGRWSLLLLAPERIRISLSV